MRFYDRPAAIWVPILYCLRRAVLAATCCLVLGYPVFQFMILFTSQIIAIVYLGHAKPYETRFELRHDYFNEMMIFFLLYHMMMFTHEHIDQTVLRFYAGASLITFTILLLFINIMIIVIPGIKKCIRDCRMKHLRKKWARLAAEKEMRDKADKIEKGEPLAEEITGAE